MNKQLFYFVFPQSGETITKEMNPLAVKDAAVKYLKTQNEVRGDICIIKDSRENVIAMGYVSDSMKVSFFTEDETVNDIKPIGVIEEGGERRNYGRRRRYFAERKTIFGDHESWAYSYGFGEDHRIAKAIRRVRAYQKKGGKK